MAGDPCNHLSEGADPVDGRPCGSQSRQTAGTSERCPEGNLQAFLGNLAEQMSIQPTFHLARERHCHDPLKGSYW